MPVHGNDGIGRDTRAEDHQHDAAPRGVIKHELRARPTGKDIGKNANCDDEPTQPIPREKYPKLIFIWGLTRVLPVIVETMSITEQQFDSLLNPVRAEVSLGLSVSPPGTCSDDIIAKGAMEYTTVAKEAMAIANLANTVELVAEMIPF